MKIMSLRMAAGSVAIALGLLGSTASARADHLTVGYSDWPGYLIWQIAIDKGWFKEAGIDIGFERFDYSSAVKLDAANVMNGDILVVNGNGTRTLMTIPIDYSSGNDLVIGKAGIGSLRVGKNAVDHGSVARTERI